MPDDPWANVGGNPFKQPAAATVVAQPAQADPWASVGGNPFAGQQQAGAQPTPQAAPPYPVIGPSGNAGQDANNFLETSADRALSGVAGLPRALAHAGDWINQHLAGQEPGAGPHDLENAAQAVGLPTGDQAMTALAKDSGGAYQPQTGLGRALMGGTSAAMGAALTGSPMGAMPAAMGGGALSQVASEAVPNHPVAAGIAGALLGGGLTQGAAQFARNPMTAAGEVSPQLAQTLQDAKSIGVNIPAPALPSSGKFANLAFDQSSNLPFSGAGAAREANQIAVQRAAIGTMGVDADHLTPDVMRQARTQIGNTYDTVLGRTNIPADNQLLTDMQNTIDQVKLRTSADNVAPVQAQADNILNTAANNGGAISGRQWKDLTAKGGPIDGLLSSSDSGLRFAGAQLRKNLTDAFQRYATPEDAQALQTADQQWKAMKTLEPLAEKAQTDGNMSPALLRGAVSKSYDDMAWNQPQLGKIAAVANMLKAPPDSGTATRELVSHVGTAGMGALGVGAAEGHYGALLPTLGAVAGSLGANRMANALMRSPVLTQRIINAGLKGPATLPGAVSSPVAQALLAQAGLAASRGNYPTSGTQGP